MRRGLHEVARVQPRQGGRLVFFKPYPTELSPASDVHVVDKLCYPAAALSQSVMVPRPCGEQSECVQHLLVEAGRVPQRIMSAVHRMGQLV